MDVLGTFFKIKANIILTDTPNILIFPERQIERSIEKLRIQWEMFYRLETRRRESSELKWYVLAVPG